MIAIIGTQSIRLQMAQNAWHAGSEATANKAIE